MAKLSTTTIEKIASTKIKSRIPVKFKRVLDSVARTSCRYESANGHVSVAFENKQPDVNEIKSKSIPLSAPMCLTKEEVKGKKVENELVIADGSKALSILPGGVIDGETLLQSGQFNYVKFDKRKPISVSTPSNLFIKTSETINPSGNTNIESSLRAGVNKIKSPSNLVNKNAVPNAASNLNVQTSTLMEKTGLDIGASFFYMGISVDDSFSFSSEKYRYMYLYEFEQTCLSVVANSVSSPADIFTDNTSMNKNWLYIKEVKYGRRLYVLIESEYDLEEYANELNGNLNWGVVSAAYKQKNTGSSFFSKTNIRILTQGGTSLAISDPADLKAAIDNYQSKKFSELEIVPLSYKLTYMDGKPVSMVSHAFLDSNNCLAISKVRVRIKSLRCVKSDDGGTNEQIFGGVGVRLINTAGKMVAVDGKTILPSPLPYSGYIQYAKESAPLILKEGQPKEFSASQQGKYLDLNISSLDMQIQLLPFMKEDDDITDDTFLTDDKMKKSIRQMLIDGSTICDFEFRDDQSNVVLTMEIMPLY
ncbi:MAG: thiol-activated cytolysin family protein [Taibaiella sp.]|jgi:hypothetical protein